MEVTQELNQEEIEGGYSDTPTVTPEPVVETVDPFAAVLARLDKFETSQSTLAGNLGGLNRTQKALQEAIEESRKVAPTQQDVEVATENPEEWAAFVEEWPEYASATEKFINSRIGKGMTAAQIEQTVNDLVEQRVSKALAESSNTALEAVFENWEEDVKTPQFDTWLTSQPDEVKDLANSARVRDAKKMLTLYYDSQKPKEPEVKQPSRTQRFSAAVAPKGAGGHASSPSEMDEIEAGYSS